MANSAFPVAGPTGTKVITEPNVSFTGTLDGTTAVVTAVSSTTGLRRGQLITGTGVAAGARILSVDSATQITLTAATTSAGAAVALTAAHGMAVDFPVNPSISDKFAPMTSLDGVTSEALGSGVVIAVSGTTYTIAFEGYEYASAGTDGDNFCAPATFGVLTTTAPVAGSGLYVVYLATQITSTTKRINPIVARQV